MAAAHVAVAMLRWLLRATYQADGVATLTILDVLAVLEVLALRYGFADFVGLCTVTRLSASYTRLQSWLDKVGAQEPFLLNLNI